MWSKPRVLVEKAAHIDPDTLKQISVQDRTAIFAIATPIRRLISCWGRSNSIQSMVLTFGRLVPYGICCDTQSDDALALAFAEGRKWGMALSDISPAPTAFPRFVLRAASWGMQTLALRTIHPDRESAAGKEVFWPSVDWCGSKLIGLTFLGVQDITRRSAIS